MTTELTMTCAVHFRNGTKGQKYMESGPAPAPQPVTVGRVPRISRLMALAIRLDRLLSDGDVRDMAELARLGHVSRARMTQILNMKFLAPDIQDELLFLPPTMEGRDIIKEWEIRPVAAALDWNRQRRIWADLKARKSGAPKVP